ncbi:hypothetical protein BDZ97DRAFT_1913740 [Flammula alnicola]|nr:hypothetical protein BDZ97DRAFT_1913740 [Flammula alnicola]
MNIHSTESAEFRLHIRNLLYKYSVSHYTTNYLTFTEDLVSEFIEDLKPIPLTDPYSLLIAVDPYQAFSQIHSLPSLAPYDEIPQTTNDARLYLKKVMGSALGIPKTKTIAWNDTYNESLPPEPFIPALTRHAREKTPKLGKKEKPHSPEQYENLLKSQMIGVIPVEPVKEETLVPEEILQVKYQFNQKSFQPYLDPTFLRNEPFVEPEWPEEPFMPIFPRSRLPRSGMASTTGHLAELKTFADIPSVVLDKVEVEDPEDNISRQNMVVVDGWETFKSSPPSTPLSKGSDSEDQLDQLFLESSPNTEPPLVEELINAKMEPVQIPRSRRIGGNSGIAPHILAGKSLGSFLQPLLSQPKVGLGSESGERKVDERERHPLSSPSPSSLLGQPPSELGSNVSRKISCKTDIQNQDLDAELKNLYAGHNLEDMIMNETVDDKQCLLMEVPDLSAPNVHPPNGMHVPVAFSEFLVLPNGDIKGQNNANIKEPRQPLHRFLKKAKGTQSLGLALSWVPFTVDKRLPSVPELIGVAELFDKKTMDDEADEARLETLLKSLDLEDKDAEKRYSWSEEACSYRPPDLTDDFQILRTRQERWRLARLENRFEDGMDCDEDLGTEIGDAFRQQVQEYGETSYDSDERVEDERSAKRLRLDLDDEGDLDRVHNVVEPPLAVIDILSERGSYGPGSPAISLSDDKENWPPATSSLSKAMDEGSSDYHSLDHVSDIRLLSSNEDVGIFQMEDEGSFEPLSFGSRLPVARRDFYGQDFGPPPGYDQDPTEFDVLEDLTEVSKNIMDDEASLEGDADGHTGLALTLEPDIASRSLGILSFAQLRARKVTETKSVPMPEPALIFPVEHISARAEPQKAPQEIFDQNTICLPDVINVASSVHRYLASLELVQKHALVRALRADECAVELVERQSLGGVDLILDPHCAIIFLSLFTLSARCGSYVERVSQQSWNFSHLLVIFEAYPEHRSKRSNTKQGRNSSASELYAYTPPIIKAIKKFRRDVSIADACGTKCPETKVEYAFADTVDEAALLTRWYGDMAEERDETQGAIWGERAWLASDLLEEDEEDRLAGINGMNHFSASIILCQASLQEFVDMSPQERVDSFGGYVGVEAIMICNTDLDARFQAIHVSSGTMESELGNIGYSE